MNLFQCSHTFHRGKRSGETCGRMVNKGSNILDDGTYLCNVHMKSYQYKKKQESGKKQKNGKNVTCKAILKSGKNKGSHCTYKIFSEGYCKLHHKHNIDITNKNRIFIFAIFECENRVTWFQNRKN
jgi:hypothetical protein